MNPTSAKSESNQTGMSTRKRKLQTNEIKEEEDKQIEQADNPSETETESNNNKNRKSLRISSKQQQQQQQQPKQITTRSSKSKDDSSSKLNGAQFVTAAAAGNLNVTNSTTTTTTSTNDSSNLNQPLNNEINKLSQNIDHINKTLAEHSALFKKLSNSIEILATRIESIEEPACNKTPLSKAKLKGALSKSEPRSMRLRNQKISNESDEKEKIQPDKLKKQLKMKQQIEQDESITNDEEIESESKSNNSSTTTIDLTEHSETPGPELAEPIKTEEETKNEQNNQQTQTITLIDAPKEAIEDQKQDPIETELIIKTIKPADNETKMEMNNQSDLNDECSSDSSNDEDDEDEESGSKKSRSSSSNSHKGANIAILNKTKIDTEFISKLIGNKYPNDKRYDPNEINKLRLLSHSYQNFAVKLLVRLFDEEEIIGRNVYGRNYSGDKSITKQPLDPERINFIKETVLRLTKTNNPELAWASCVIAMNRKMVDINNKYLKNLKNKKEEN